MKNLRFVFGGGRTQEERLQEGERVDDGAEICQTDGDACGGGAAGQKAGRQGLLYELLSDDRQ